MTKLNIAFLVDAQLPPALARAITDAGYPARHVSDVGLLQAADMPIWDFAREQGCALITKDEDFVAIRLRETEGATVVWLERFQADWNRSHAKMGVPKRPQVRFVGLRFSITGGTDALAAWQILFAGSSRACLRGGGRR